MQYTTLGCQRVQNWKFKKVFNNNVSKWPALKIYLDKDFLE